VKGNILNGRVSTVRQGGERRLEYNVWFGNLKERDHWKNLGVH
jgi:hypothetical protein